MFYVLDGLFGLFDVFVFVFIAHFMLIIIYWDFGVEFQLQLISVCIYLFDKIQKNTK